MARPLRITFRNFSPSPEVDPLVRRKADKLFRLNGRITHLDIAIERPHHSRHKGYLFEVRIVMTLPGTQRVVNRHPPQHRQHESLELAVSDAFHAAERELRDLHQQRSGAARRAEAELLGTR